jgi:predicted amidophosphoribosyltransferase
MQCPQCQQENPPQAKFCLEGGTRLALMCAQCGTELPAGAKFCLECGRPVSGAVEVHFSCGVYPKAPRR